MKGRGGARRRLVHRCRAPNGCRQLVRRPERSRSCVLEMVGINVASSAQLKRAGTGVELGGTELGGGTGDGGCKMAAAGVMYSGGSSGRKRGVSVGVDGVVGDVGRVYHTGDGKAACFQGFWGKQGGWDAFRGCSGGSGGVFRRSERPGSRSEGGGTRGTGVAEYDVAAALGGSRCSTGVRGTSWGGQSGVGSCGGRRWRRWGRQCSSVEQMACSNECVGAWARNTASWAVDGLCVSFGAW
jgi:hypothetical protein